MPSQCHHPDTMLVIQIAPKQHRRTPSENLQYPPDMRQVSSLPGERDSSPGESSVACTIYGQNCTISWSLNNSGGVDIPQGVTSTPSITQRRSINTPTAMPGIHSCSTPAPGAISQADSTRPIVPSLASGIASTPTPLSGLEILPTSIPNPEACATNINPLRTPATEWNRSQRKWEFQPQVVPTTQWVVSGSRSIHRFGHSDMMRLVYAKARLMELIMSNRWPFMRASHLEIVSYAMWRSAKALAEVSHWQIIEMYWNTAMQQSNIWSIALEPCTKEMLK